MSHAYREFGLNLLDDEHGVNSQAWKVLVDLLDEDDDGDVVDAVELIDGRYRIPEGKAKALWEKDLSDIEDDESGEE